MRFRPRAILLITITSLLGLVHLSDRSLAAIEGINWFPIGPAPLDGSFGVVSGRASAIAVNPENVDDIWIGAAGGGVWHSTNGGNLWSPMSDGEVSLAIGAVAVAGCDAQDCSWVYAGTGENAIRRDTFYGRGLLVGSFDGADIFWTLQDGSPDYDFALGSIYNVVLDPSTSGSTQVIYITLSSGTTSSATTSTVTAPEPSPGGYGIYKSGTNGASWTKMTVPGSEGARPTDLEMDVGDPDTLYAGFMGRGVFVTDDAGATWCPLNPGIDKPQGCPNSNGLPDPNETEFDHVEIATAPSAPNTIYVSFGHCPDRFGDSCIPSLFRTTNGGNSWQERMTGSSTPPPSPQVAYACDFEDLVGSVYSYSRYTHSLAVSPANDDVLYMGGLVLCRSEDGGSSWSDINSFLHPDHRTLVYHPNNAQRLYGVSDGGFYVSTNGGGTFSTKNHKLQTIGFQTVAASPLTSKVIGGAQDNGGMMYTGATLWDGNNCCGDGGFSVMDRDTALKMYITSNVGTFVDVIPRRSSDGGADFQADSDFINVGLKGNGDPRSVYPPFVQAPNPPHHLFFGTNRLFRSTNDAGNWTAISPVLSNTPQTEIRAGVDVITAVGVAPGDPDRIYLGYYSGKVFVTDAPCANMGCWSQEDTGLPDAPVSWIAVHPDQPDTAYATLSGFGSGVHVYKTNNAGGQWSATAAHPDLNGVPVNSITIEPGSPGRLWLGTDIGVYKSTNSGGNWFRFSNNLPNVPVFSIDIDTNRGRVYAATHGRSAYILTRPFLSNFEGWVNDSIWDIPVYGHGFQSNQNCTLKILRQNGTVCASGSIDALGGDIQTDDDGVLVTDKNLFYMGQPVAWACNKGNCLGGVDISNCNQPGNPLTTVLVKCGNQISIDHVLGCPSIGNPPSSFFTLFGFDSLLPPAAAPSSIVETPPALEELPVAGSFDLLPTVQAADGSSRILCSVGVPYQATDTVLQVLENSATAVNGSAVCQVSGVTADAPPGEVPGPEDLPPIPDHLRLQGAGIVGGQLIPSLRVGAGQAPGACFTLDALGMPVSQQIRIMRLRFDTEGGTAQGGDMTLVETSPLGVCQITVPTTAGDSAGQVAQAVESAFQAAGIPGPHPFCPAHVNPRDVDRLSDSVVWVLASQIDICMNDAGVGFTLAPEEICFADEDCDDANPCTRNVCDTVTGQCQSTPEPDGTLCDDADLCTFGNTCLAGLCGTPIDCSDRNLCTADSCDPRTGQCQNAPIECDDGNECTLDSCDGTTGECSFTPLTGLSCDDGDLCTSLDVCVLDPVTAQPLCQGAPACADTNPCTVDTCDPETGQCSNPPVQCDDDNQCTIDSCDPLGVCRYQLRIGASCDDGDLCSLDDFCVEDPVRGAICEGTPLNCDDLDLCTNDRCDPTTGLCEHDPVTCDDQDVCTADACEPATGLCSNASIPLNEVKPIDFVNGTTLSWSPTNLFTAHWNTYKGTIPRNLLGSRLPGPVYDQICHESDDAFADGPTISTVAGVPPLGTAWYFEVSEEGVCGEGPFCPDSAGIVRPNASPCPTPP